MLAASAPNVAVSAPASIMFRDVWLAVTFTEIVQLPDAGIVAPVTLMDPAPAAAVITGDPQPGVELGAGLDVFTIPVGTGYVSVKLAPVIAVATGLDKTILRREVAPAKIGLAGAAPTLNDLLMPG